MSQTIFSLSKSSTQDVPELPQDDPRMTPGKIQDYPRIAQDDPRMIWDDPGQPRMTPG